MWRPRKHRNTSFFVTTLPSIEISIRHECSYQRLDWRKVVNCEPSRSELPRYLHHPSRVCYTASSLSSLVAVSARLTLSFKSAPWIGWRMIVLSGGHLVSTVSPHPKSLSDIVQRTSTAEYCKRSKVKCRYREMEMLSVYCPRLVGLHAGNCEVYLP
jgi:hypothetical protein